VRSWKDNVRFVLVEPREPGNIGACARAIKNMGFRNLCLVNPGCAVNDEAKCFARHAGDVLEKALVCESLAEAINDASLIVGTTRRKGRSRGVFMDAEAGCRRVFSAARDNRVAILFGREDRGLFNEETGECGFLLTISASRDQPSLNLSQAVMIVAYELRQAEHERGNSGSRFRDPLKESDRAEFEREVSAGGSENRRAGSGALVTHADLSTLYERMAGTLRQLEYIPKGDRNLEKKMMMNLKRLIGRAGLTGWELKMLHGLCSRIEQKCSGTARTGGPVSRVRQRQAQGGGFEHRANHRSDSR
jgi:TrmH family RNA methyltransferase